jgi:hypothetical protein
MQTEPSELVASLLAQDDEPTPAPEPLQAEPVPAPEVQPVVAEAQPEPESIEPLSLKQYAEKAGTDPKDLYALRLPSGLTVQELNDKSKDYEQLDVNTVEFEGERATFRAEQAKHNQYIRDWAALVQRGENDPQALVRLEQQRTHDEQQAQLQTLELIPEWREPTARTADKQRIEAFTGRFGAPQGTADGLTAPWANSMMRYVLTLEDRFQAALKTVEKVKNKPIPAAKRRDTSNTPPQGLNPAAAALLKGL